MKNLLLVSMGGFLGTGMRYLVSGISHRVLDTQFPIGTFIVNFTGAFILGFFMEYAVERAYLSDAIRLMIVIGVLGGFTTFSSFSYETIALFRAGNTTYGLLNLFLTNLFCLGGVLMGMKATVFWSKGI